MLLELNPDVKGEYVEENPWSLVENNPQYFLHFTVVIVCGVCNDSVKKLAGLLWDANIPLFLCISYGFVGKLLYYYIYDMVVHKSNCHDRIISFLFMTNRVINWNNSYFCLGKQKFFAFITVNKPNFLFHWSVVYLRKNTFYVT